MAEEARIEKFTSGELAKLRNEMMKCKMDSWQTADMVSAFLAGRGYGVNANAMRTAIPQMAMVGGSHEAMQAVLETCAFVM
jgi:hypothetical protein